MNIAEVLLRLEDIAAAPINVETFGFDLIEAYGPPKATLAKLRQSALNKPNLLGDVIWNKKFHFRVASAGESPQMLDELRLEWTKKKQGPRLLVTSDGEELCAYDQKLDETLNTHFSKLAERYDFFLPLAGVERYQGVIDSPADIKAAGRLAKFYDAILEANPDWTAHQRVHELNIFLTRILFCMFAQSTGIFSTGLFSTTLIECTSIDGSDIDTILKEVFECLDLDGDERARCPEYAKRFPYVNGRFFRNRSGIPRFSKLARRILIDAAKLNWADVNPDIFGSMIQAVVKPELRDELGMHYTSVPNIMKVLRRR